MQLVHGVSTAVRLVRSCTAFTALSIFHANNLSTSGISVSIIARDVWVTISVVLPLLAVTSSSIVVVTWIMMFEAVDAWMMCRPWQHIIQGCDTAYRTNLWCAISLLFWDAISFRGPFPHISKSASCVLPSMSNISPLLFRVNSRRIISIKNV